MTGHSRGGFHSWSAAHVERGLVLRGEKLCGVFLALLRLGLPLSVCFHLVTFLL